MARRLSISDERPLATLAILAYRQEGIVADAVAAALAQTYTPLEILISDDASPDGTFDAIRAAVAGYEGPHSIVLNRNDCNRGIAAHVDRVTALSSGAMIVVNAGDDRSLPNRVETVMAEWDRGGRRADGMHSAVVKLDMAVRPESVACPEPVMHGAPGPIDIAGRYCRAIGAGLAWTPRIYDRFGPLAGHCLVEDHVIPWRATLMGDCPTSTSRWSSRSRAGSPTSNRRPTSTIAIWAPGSATSSGW